MLRFLYGGKSVPTGAVELGAGIYANENADGILVLTTDPTDYGGQTPGPAALGCACYTVRVWGGADDDLELQDFPSVLEQADPRWIFPIRIGCAANITVRIGRYVSATGVMTGTPRLALQAFVDGAWKYFDDVSGPSVRVMSTGYELSKTIQADQDIIDASLVMCRVVAVNGTDVADVAIGAVDVIVCLYPENVIPDTGEGFPGFCTVYTEDWTGYADVAAMRVVWPVQVNCAGADAQAGGFGGMAVVFSNVTFGCGIGGGGGFLYHQATLGGFTPGRLYRIECDGWSYQDAGFQNPGMWGTGGGPGTTHESLDGTGEKLLWMNQTANGSGQLTVKLGYWDLEFGFGPHQSEFGNVRIMDTTIAGCL